MVKCDICGKEFKNTQGLRGHKNFVHSDKVSSIKKPVTQQLSSELEQPVTKLELLEFKLQQLETKLEQVTSIAQQANELAEKALSNSRRVPYYIELLEKADEHIEKLVNERVNNLRSEFVNKIDKLELRVRKLEPPHCTVLKKPDRLVLGTKRVMTTDST